jgi:hypothetical protein
LEIKASGFLERIALAYLSLFFYLSSGLLLYNFSELKTVKVYLLVALFLSLIDTVILGLTGYNLAGLLLGLKTVSSYETKPLGVVKAVLRYFFSWFSVLLLGLGYLAAAFNARHRTLQDAATSAIVIRSELIPYISRPLAMSLTIPALIMSLAIPLGLGTVLVNSVKSSYLLMKLPYYSSPVWDADSSSPAQMLLAGGHVVALTRLDPNELSYIPFSINTKGLESTISEAQLKELKFTNYIYKLASMPADILAASLEDLTNIKIERYVLVPELILQDISQKDLIVYDLLLKVADKSSLAKDFLDSFYSSVSSCTGAADCLKLGLHSEEQSIFADTEIEPAYRNFLLLNLAQLHQRWEQCVARMPARLTEELTLVKDKSQLVNPVMITVQATTGYVTGAIMVKPSKNLSFNSYTKEFITDLKRLKAVPFALRDRYPDTYELKLDLELESQDL